MRAATPARETECESVSQVASVSAGLRGPLGAARWAAPPPAHRSGDPTKQYLDDRA